MSQHAEQLVIHLLNRSEAVPIVQIEDNLHDIITAAEYHQVTPLTLRSLKSNYELSLHSKKVVMAKLKTQQMHAMMFKQILPKFLGILEKENIPVILLKGAALGLTEYEEFWHRHMGDIDFVVPFEQRLDALKALVDAGYTYVPYEIMNKPLSPQDTHLFFHHYQLFDTQYANRPIELHFSTRLDENGYLAYPFTEWLWHYSEVVESEIGLVRVLVPTAHIIHLCLHEVVQHENVGVSISFRTLYDIWLLITNHQIIPDVLFTFPYPEDWDHYIVEVLLQVNKHLPLRQGYLKHFETYDYQQQPQSNQIKQALDTKADNRNRERNYRRLEYEFKHATISGKIGMAKRMLFPSIEEIRNRYKVSDNTFIALWYVRHSIGYINQAISILFRKLTGNFRAE